MIYGSIGLSLLRGFHSNGHKRKITLLQLHERQKMANFESDF